MADKPIIFSAPMVRALLAGRKSQTRWTSLHGPDAWAANPWICAISFEVKMGNIDAI